MHRERIDKLFEEIRVRVESDSSSLTREDQDRIDRLLGEVREEVRKTYDRRENPNGQK